MSLEGRAKPVVWKQPSLWLGILTTLLVVGFTVRTAGRKSPGPLTTAHQQVADLEGGQSCAECHGGWTESMSSACLDCHQAIGDDRDAARGLHGLLAAEESCATCHSDHHGGGFAMVNAQSFALAGASREAFEHASIGFAMEGGHLELECNECHENAEVDVLPEGHTRFLGLEQDCASCHEDPHEGRMVPSCVQCHGQEAFDQLDSTGHERFLPLIGGHAELDCNACHAEGLPQSLRNIGQGKRPAARDCMDCHDSPHRGTFIGSFAASLELERGATCASCHLPEHTSFDEEEPHFEPGWHAASGFRLEAPHAELDCAQCHPDAARYPVAYPGRDAEDCQSCHEDPHGGQFEGGAFGAESESGGCLACHSPEAFEPHAFTVADHTRTSFPLDGAHLEAECQACHQIREPDTPRVFAGTASRCDRCHEDSHGGFFARSLRRHPQGGNDCSRCHATSAFAQVEPEDFDHGQWTGFAVRGAHAQEDCSLCHLPAESPDATGRTFGRVEEHFGAFEGCAGCHEDPHRGEFDDPSLPQRVEGEEGCARCHVQSSFRAFPQGFDHRLWTGFPLVGRHKEIGCTPCHAPLPEPDAFGRSWGEAQGTSCIDCHREPHAGQFVEAGVTDCTRCHSPVGSFERLTFDHERDARFALGEAHRALDCAACHEAWPTASGFEVVRYKPLGRDCTDCHGADFRGGQR